MSELSDAPLVLRTGPYIREFERTCYLALAGFTIFVFPILRLSGLPIPMVLLLGVFAYPFDFDRRFARIAAFTGLYIAVLSAVHYATGQFLFRDALYFSIFVFYLLIYLSISGALRLTGPDAFVKLLKVALVCEVVLIIAQRQNLGGINDILSPYWAQLSSNIANATLHGVLSFRPFGTFGNPTYAGFVFYLLARTVYVWDGRKRWLALGLVGVVLTTARMALVAMIAFEAFVLLVRAKPATRVVILVALGGLGVATVGLLIFLYQSGVALPFSVRIIAQLFLGMYSIQTDYSFTHRLSMIQWMGENSRMLLFGGMGSEQLPQYVDSEFVLRSVQFGGFGFLLMHLVWISEAWKWRSLDALFLIYLTLVGSLTNTIATNVFFVTFLIIYARVLGIANSRRTTET